MPDFIPDVVLDTHVWLWWVTHQRLAGEAIQLIEAAAAAGRVHVPAISVWEVALLVAKGRITLTTPLREWTQRALDLPGFALAPLLPEVAIESCMLPGLSHGDPADRMIVATARRLDATLVTRDERLIAYALSGHVMVMPA